MQANSGANIIEFASFASLTEAVTRARELYSECKAYGAEPKRIDIFEKKSEKVKPDWQWKL